MMPMLGAPARADEGAARGLPAKPEGEFAIGTSMYRIAGGDIKQGVAEGGKSGAAVAPDGAGGFVLVWAGRIGERPGADIFAQRVDGLGRPMGRAVIINQGRAGEQSRPAVARAADGSVWAVWESFGNDGESWGIAAQRISVAGAEVVPVGSEVVVNESHEGAQCSPAVTALAAGGALITWVAQDAQSTSTFAMGRRFGSAGEPRGGEFRVSEAAAGAESNVTTAALPEGGFVAVWQVTSEAAAGGETFTEATYAVRARWFDAEGRALGVGQRVGVGNERDEIEPAIDVDGIGRVTAAWMRQRAIAAEGYDVWAQRFDAQGRVLAEPFAVSEGSEWGWKNGVAVACAVDGRTAVSYNVVEPAAYDSMRLMPAMPSSIVTHLYGADGNVMREAVRVTNRSEEAHDLPVGSSARRAVWTEEDQIALAFIAAEDQEEQEIGLKVIVPAAMNLPAPSMTASFEENDTSSGRTIPPVFDPNWVPLDDEVGIAAVGPDFGFDGPQASGWYPPDPDIAAGPNHVVTVANGVVAFYDKTGNRTFITCLSCFWAELGANGFVFDPIALWDNYSSRFIVAAAEGADNGDSYIDLAISDDTDPNGTWYKYRVRTEQLGDFLDFPNLGVGPDAVYIAGDYFGSPSANQIHIFPKAPLLNGGPIELKNVQTTGYPVSLGAVKSYDAAPPAQYFISSYTAYPTLRIEAIRNATSTPVWNSFNLSVPGYGQPPGAPQKGTSNLAATVDFRIKNGVYRDGSLYATHAIAGIGVPKQRWYRIEMNGWPTSGQNPTLAEYGDVVMGSGIAGWFGDINVSNQGEVVMTMNRSSATEYISVQRTVKKVYDLNFRTPVIAQESTSPEQGSRWGDYSGLEEDPAAPGTFWGLTEYRTADWRTWVTRVDANKTMIVSASTLRAGQPGTLTATNCAAGGKVNFYYSARGEGSTVIDSLNVTLDIDRAKFIGSVTADAGGVANLTRTVQPGTGNTLVWIQAAEWDNRSQVLLTQINR